MSVLVRLLACFAHCSLKYILPHSTPFEAISQVTHGHKSFKTCCHYHNVECSVWIGVDVPLTENDYFDENSEEIDNATFNEYLMQEDNDKEQKKRRSVLWST